MGKRITAYARRKLKGRLHRGKRDCQLDLPFVLSFRAKATKFRRTVAKLKQKTMRTKRPQRKRVY